MLTEGYEDGRRELFVPSVRACNSYTIVHLTTEPVVPVLQIFALSIIGLMALKVLVFFFFFFFFFNLFC